MILRDISRHGAGIEVPPRAALGLEGVLRRWDLALKCRVVWTLRGLGGLKFRRPLDSGQMRDVRPMIEAREAGGLARLAASSRASPRLGWRHGRRPSLGHSRVPGRAAPGCLARGGPYIP